MTLQDIIKLIDETNAKNILLLCHHNADPDALGSAFAFQNLLLKVRPQLKIEIGTSQSISRLSKQLLDYIPMNVSTQPKVEQANILILLDTNTVKQLDNLAEKVAESQAPLVVIDHHSPHPDTINKARILITQEEASSASEIVHDFYKQLKIKPDLETAKALFLGIAFDTRHFVLGNSSTFKTVAELIDQGVNAKEALTKLTVPMDLSERTARLKAVKRAKILTINSWIIALSRVSAYQASAARALVDLGADMAAVAGKKGETLEVSMRCTRDFTQQTGIHLGRDIAKTLGEKLQGMGGGHNMAAGVNAKGEVPFALKECLALLRTKLSNQQ
jgi:phosphoesterase RecJ-like protein